MVHVGIDVVGTINLKFQTERYACMTLIFTCFGYCFQFSCIHACLHARNNVDCMLLSGISKPMRYSFSLHVIGQNEETMDTDKCIDSNDDVIQNSYIYIRITSLCPCSQIYIVH